RTVTGAGARQFAARLAAPLTDAAQIDRRLDGVQFFVRSSRSRNDVRETLRSIPDVDRALSRLALERGGPRDLAAIRDALAEVPAVRAAVAGSGPLEPPPAAIVEALAERPYHSVLDMGTGTGRMLQLLIGDRLDVRAIGLDNSHSMLGVARANLERAEVHGVDLRQGDVYSPPVEPGFDLVVVHQVLHFLHDPARAVHEARRLLNPGGRLLIVDFAPHALEFLRADHAHRRLGFRDDTIVGWLEQSGLRPDEPCRIEPQHGATNPDDERLVVTLWLAHDRAAAPTTDSPTDAVPEGALR
ncbi:MAG: methyltransferase domain-containing protein, partial [Ilumatobacter fluminis]